MFMAHMAVCKRVRVCTCMNGERERARAREHERERVWVCGWRVRECVILSCSLQSVSASVRESVVFSSISKCLPLERY